MITIKLYSRTYTALTTLTEADFNALQYKRAVGEIGDCEFLVRLDRPKITDTNIALYNRVEVIEHGAIQFVGVITYRKVLLDTAVIRCRELPFILKRRLLPGSYAINTTIATAVTNLLSTINGVDNTGITADVSDATGSINTTFQNADAFTILKQITKATGNQFMLNASRQIVVALQVGEQTNSVLRYNVNQISAANILRFAVEDDGENIVTRAQGKSGSLTSTVENATLTAKYGWLQSFRDFRVANTQGVLNDFTMAEVADRIYSPEIEVNPNTPDTFSVGDRVRLVLRNALINIDEVYQVLEKKVQYVGMQKRVSVRINDLPHYLAEKLAERDARLDLLEKQL